MKSFLTDVKYTAVPVLPDMIPSNPGQEEQILWVGCSDSQIDETDVLDVPRRELFVHRNLGNILSNGDISSLGAIEFCVQDIKVKHIIICGHYGCGLINSSGENHVTTGWLADLGELRKVGKRFFDQDLKVEDRDRRLVELNVLAQVHWVMQQANVVRAIGERAVEYTYMDPGLQQEVANVAAVVTAERVGDTHPSDEENGSPRPAKQQRLLPSGDPSLKPSHNKAGSQRNGNSDEENGSPRPT